MSRIWTRGIGLTSIPLIAIGAGLVLVLIPSDSLVGAVIAVVGVSFVYLMRRLDAVPTRIVDFLLASLILYLPIAPYLVMLDPRFTIVRFVLAAALMAAMLLGAVPTKLSAWSRGRMWAVVAFSLYQLVPFVSAGASAYSTVRLLNWVMFIPCAFIDYDRKMFRVIAAATITAGIAELAAVALQVTGRLSGTWGGLAIGGSTHVATRYSGFLLNPNDLGLFMVGVTVAAFAIGQRHRTSAFGRVVAFGFLGLSGLAVLLSASRGALLAVPVVAMFVVFSGYRRFLVALGLTTLLVVIAVPWLVPAAAAPFRTTTESLGAVMFGRDQSAVARVDRWRSLIARGEGDPILGTGYGGYVDHGGVDVTNTQSRAEAYLLLTVDSGWLKLWLEQGLIGCLLLAAVFVVTLRRAMDLVRRGGTTRVIGMLGGAILLAIVVRAGSADILDINPWNFLIWLLVGVVNSSWRRARIPEEQLAPLEGQFGTAALANETSLPAHA